MAKKIRIELGSSGLPLAATYPESDYHETEEALWPLYAIGRISLIWNFCEHVLNTLIWPHFGDYEKGMAVTANLGNQSRADLLLVLARKYERNKQILDRIEFIAKAFNRLRENRNILMHSHSIRPYGEDGLEWRRTSVAHGHVGSLASMQDLLKMENDIAALTDLILSITAHYAAIENRKPRQKLSNIFPMPDKFIQLPPDEAVSKKSDKKKKTRKKARPSARDGKK